MFHQTPSCPRSSVSWSKDGEKQNSMLQKELDLFENPDEVDKTEEEEDSPPSQKRKCRSFSDKKIIEEQMEMIRIQKVAWEKQSMLYSKMMDFFDKSITVLDTVLKRAEQEPKEKRPPQQQQKQQANDFVPYCGDSNIADSYVSF
ncbi:hypothetical protein ANCCAN_09039 [Ancylostoma caninum]|uniref:Uncharacterized protein n=1 Tax=Ancylostoma caninum TaxID=29170 RepID=A0A368GPJ0_ANCCA|nr:hypothetical protein ANCCAN_09039 [Ancylostoma caninum]